MVRLCNKELEFNKRFKITIEGSYPSAWKINQYLTKLGIRSLPDDFDTAPSLVEKDKYGLSGSLNKRISKVFYKLYQEKLDDAVLSKISNFYKMQCTPDAVLEFEFRERFDWPDGRFKDRDSCWFTFNGGAPILIKDKGGAFVCFYNEDRPCGRAVLLPISDDVLAVVNSYGPDLSTAATAMRIFFEQEATKTITILNDARKKSRIRTYILYFHYNQGFLVGSKETIDSIDDDDDGYNLDWDEYGYGVIMCNNCRKYYQENNECNCR